MNHPRLALSQDRFHAWESGGPAVRIDIYNSARAHMAKLHPEADRFYLFTPDRAELIATVYMKKGD